MLQSAFFDANLYTRIWALADPELQFRGGAHGERGARAYNGGLGAEPPAGSRGRAPGQGVKGQSPLKLKAFWPSDVQQTLQICTLGPLQYFQFKASYSNLNP